MADAFLLSADVACHVWRAERARGAVLLQHGYAEYAGRYVEHYHRLIPHLLDLGLDVHAFDMEGHGGSPGARGAVDVRRAVRTHVEVRHALGKPLFLFGHSLGGLVTAASVARDPGNVLGVVLSAPALLVPASAPARLAARMLATVAPTSGMIPPQASSGLSRLTPEVQAFDGDPHVYRGRLPWRMAYSALVTAREGWAAYDHWTVPTLVLHGTDDTYTDPRGSALFAGLIRSADKRLSSYPGGRHELLNDVNRDRALGEILGWLRDRIP